MIVRNPASAQRAAYDLIIVGCGIYGAMMALESARRGLRPLVVERHDFGEHTSWNSLRIIHGGLRYLQTLDFERFFESVQERSWFLAQFPELVKPLPCLMPLYAHGLRRAAVLKPVLWLNDRLAHKRNAGVPPANHLPDCRLLSNEEARALFPAIDQAGLAGAALWFDAVMTHPHRVVVEILHWACEAGATCLNYIEFTELLQSDGVVVGISARDAVDGSELEFRAPVVVNCAGPWSRAIAAQADRDRENLFRPSLAFNLMLRREPPFSTAVAVAPKTPGARTYFLYPYGGCILAGTYHAPWNSSGLDAEPSEAQIIDFLSDINAAIPDLGVKRSDVIRTMAGLLPASSAGGDRLAKRAVILDHGAAGGPRGFISVSGVKFTTARAVAEEVLQRICRPLPPYVVDRGRPDHLRQRSTRLVGPPGGPEWSQDVRQEVSDQEAVVSTRDLLLRRVPWGCSPERANRTADD